MRKCLTCKSPRIVKFIDGFGERRIFCKWCGKSFLESIFIELDSQKNLVEFGLPVQGGS